MLRKECDNSSQAANIGYHQRHGKDPECFGNRTRCISRLSCSYRTRLYATKTEYSHRGTLEKPETAAR